jgi:hypothetical protein
MTKFGNTHGTLDEEVTTSLSNAGEKPSDISYEKNVYDYVM